MPMLPNRRYNKRKVSVGAYTLYAYRRDDKLGKGPAFSVHEGKRELMRFDLFPPAHRHYAWVPERHLYPEGFELDDYLGFAINDMGLWYPSLITAAAWIREQITDLNSH